MVMVLIPASILQDLRVKGLYVLSFRVYNV